MKSRLKFSIISASVFASMLITNVVTQVQAQEKEAVQEEAAQEEADEVEDLELAGGDFIMKFPTAWSKVEAKSSMIEAEFKIPVSEDDESERDGRLTIMPAGGSIDANIERWKGQFSQPDGGSTSDKTKVEVIEVAGMKVHMVEIAGTYAERARMTAPPTMRDDYQMLAAIVETGAQQYFIKFYAGTVTVDANKERFQNFIKSFERLEQ